MAPAGEAQKADKLVQRPGTTSFAVVTTSPGRLVTGNVSTLSAFVLERVWALVPVPGLSPPSAFQYLDVCSATRSNRHGLPETTQFGTRAVSALPTSVAGLGGIDDTLLDYW